VVTGIVLLANRSKPSQPPGSADTRTTMRGPVNLRREPGRSSSPVVELPVSSRLTVTRATYAQGDSWYAVRSETRRTGWVHGEAFRPIGRYWSPTASATQVLDTMNGARRPATIDPSQSFELVREEPGWVVLNLGEGLHGWVRVQPEAASLAIATEPTGALITINGEPAGTSPQTIQRPPGTYVIRATMNGRQPAERTVTVEAGRAWTVSLTLPELPPADTRVAVSVTSVPPGARLSIDGDPVGTTPYEGRLRPGPHRFRAVLGNRNGTETRNIRVGEDNNVIIRLREPIPTGIAVRITSVPAGALVTIDGVPRNSRTPYQTDLTPRPEPYIVGFSLDGYPDGVMTVEVTGETEPNTEFVYRFRRPR
jgi:hypothetical protein